jgi:hypothetical protein
MNITKINYSILLKKIIGVYSQNHTKPINTFCEQNAELFEVIAAGTYSYHEVLKG